MSDNKSYYSSNSKNYVNNVVPKSEIDLKHYNDSKKKEEIHNESWSKQKVNINEVVDKFAPNSPGYVNGYKFIYEGDKYQVVTDMVAGYLRIKNKKTNQYVKLDGKPGSREETHFKIKKKEEM